jgi:DeoR family glycerol-3-phosphate regulon repressor
MTRIHGGAIIASGVENLAYEARRFVAAEEKKAIGAAAAELIPNGCSLFINIGTTTVLQPCRTLNGQWSSFKRLFRVDW